MKIECVKEKLLEAVQKAEKIAGKNLTLPILSALALEAENNQLLIKSTNLDLGIEIVMPVKIFEEGKVAVPGSVLLQFLSNLPRADKVKLEVSDSVLVVSTERVKTSIKTFPYEDFPIIPRLSGGKHVQISASDFAEGLRSVWYSSAVTSMKPELSSVYVYHEEGDLLVFAATDSFRLAEKRMKIKKTGDFGSILIPFKNVSEIIRVLEGVRGDVQAVISENQISFSWEGYYVVSRVIEGTFPDYKQIIPKEASTEVVVLKQDLTQSLKLANVFSDSFHQMVLTVSPKDKKFEIMTRNNDIGESRDQVDAVLRGDDLTISFNYRYIVDCFQSIASDSVSLSFHGLGRPLVVRGVSDPSFLYLVMPMNK